MKFRSYNRSEIISFCELSEAQQSEILESMDIEQANEDSFVMFDNIYKGVKTEVPLPLSMFMRIHNNPTQYPCTRWHGVYNTSAFTCYFIRLSNCGSMALIADCYI